MFCPETYPELKNRQNTELMEQFAEYTKKNMYKVINIMFHTRKKNKCRKLSVLQLSKMGKRLKVGMECSSNKRSDTKI